MKPETENKIRNIVNKNNMEVASRHYYGDEVRFIYLLIAIVMIVTTPFFKYQLLLQSLLSIIAVVGFTIFAGLTNPKSAVIIIIDFVISIAASVVFGYQTIASYAGDYTDLFFLANVLLFILSVLALYFSTKTLRGNLLTS